VLYVLTQGNALVIMQVSQTPEFVVTEEGLFTIHTLVYDGTLPLEAVEFGVTTGGDVLGLIEGQGICASLDAAGAPITVTTCAPPCNAGEDAEVVLCFTDPTVWLLDYLGENVCPGGSWNGPNGSIFTGLFEPASGVQGAYAYTVTGSDGETYSATVTVTVIECPSGCQAFAGTLEAVEEEPCEEPAVTLIEAVILDAPVVPDGFEVLYVLTSGTDMIIENVGPEPAFVVDAPGLYTIHTLVYDANTLDLGVVEFGVTPAPVVYFLTEDGGGDICASLDLDGAKITVLECPAISGIAVSLYPVPADELLYLEVDVRGAERAEFSVHDLSGREVLPQAPLANGPTRTVVPLNNLLPGQYFVRVVSGSQAVAKPFLKVR
jgi:hypothetical protein